MTGLHLAGLLALLLSLLSCEASSSQPLRARRARAASPQPFATMAAGSSAAIQASSQVDGRTDPELPRILFNTDEIEMPQRTRLVRADEDLQQALNEALPGDELLLEAGATFFGNFVLPAKSGAGWIHLRSSAPASDLPASDVRLNPSFQRALPKLVTPNSQPALQTAAGAHHYRIANLEVTIRSGVTDCFNLIALGGSEDSQASLPHHLVFDQVYVHGDEIVNLRRGVALNSATTAIINSWISECHHRQFDAQAIAGWAGPGPYRIVNNYLEGSGENVIFGGADPTIPGLVPSDIEFRRNHCAKPLEWQEGHPGYKGTHWAVKNLFELKNARRVLIEGNLFENNWADAQSGFAILFTVRNQDGNAPWSTVQDVTFCNNNVRRSANGLIISGIDDVHPSLQMSRIRVADNLLDSISETFGSAGSSGRAFQIAYTPDVWIEHNTVFQSGNLLTTYYQPSPRFIFRHNLAPHNEYGFFGDGVGLDNEAIRHYFPDGIITHNVIIGGERDRLPPENFFPASITEIGFRDFRNSDYGLLPTSPYAGRGVDGCDIGRDTDLFSLVNVSAASYRDVVLSRNSIVSVFGRSLSPGIQVAAQLPLPTTLGGTTVRLRDHSGSEYLAPLFFVSPTQINYLIPPETASGYVEQTITGNGRVISSGFIRVGEIAPAIFTSDASGNGLAAALVLRDRQGTQSIEPVARFDVAQNRFSSVPIDVSVTTDEVWLVLFGTGIRHRSALSSVVASVGGVRARVGYAGEQSQMAGLDQVNVLLPPTLNGRGETDVFLVVDGLRSNTVRIHIR